MFSLSITHKDGPPRMEKFSQAEVSIGRVPGNDLVLPGANISKRHARIVFNYSKGSFVVIDNKSTNGTTINGERIDGPYDLQEGDKIYIGDFIIEVRPGAKGAKPDGTARPRAKLAPLKGEKTQQATADDVEEALGGKAKKSGLDDFEEEDWDDAPAAAPADDWDDELDDAPKAKPAPAVTDEWEDEDDPGEPAAPAKKPAAAEEEDWEEEWDDSSDGAAAASPAPSAELEEEDEDWDEGASSTPAKKDEDLDEVDELDELEAGISSKPRPSKRSKPTRPARAQSDDDILAELEDDLAESKPKPKPKRKPSNDAPSEAEIISCLQRYIEIDEAYRLKSFGKPCDCGECLLCQAREALEQAGNGGGDSPGRGRRSARRRD